MGPYARDDVDETAAVPETRAERRDRATADTRASILAAARTTLLAVGYANLSTRAVADAAEVPLSQIHYHFGSKQQLILAVLEGENARLLERQRTMYAGPEPLWRQWEQACDFLEEDLRSGLCPRAPGDGRGRLVGPRGRGGGAGVRRRLVPAAGRGGGRGAGYARRPGPVHVHEVAALMGLPFLGAESIILLGFTESELPARSALRKLGDVIRTMEEA